MATARPALVLLCVMARKIAASRKAPPPIARCIRRCVVISQVAVTKIVTIATMPAAFFCEYSPRTPISVMA